MDAETRVQLTIGKLVCENAALQARLEAVNAQVVAATAVQQAAAAVTDTKVSEALRTVPAEPTNLDRVPRSNRV